VWESKVRADLARMQPSQSVEFLTGQTTDAVMKRMHELTGGDVVFTPGYFKDGAGQVFAPRDSAMRIASASGAPVYGPFATFIGTGVVGGRMPGYTEMGRQGAKTVNALLDGVAPAKLRQPASIPPEVNVDWRQVLRWGIDPNAIPASAIVHFREPSFWETNRNTVISVVVVILLQAALIAALLIERRLRRRTASALEASEQRMSLAARAPGLSIWVWDIAREKVSTTGKLRQRRAAVKDQAVSFNQVLDVVHPADRAGFNLAVQRAAASGEELDVEYRIQQPSGEMRWFAARGRAANEFGGQYTGVALDITARKTAELQAEKDRVALTHMTRVSMLGQLSASIAHQLNQPLAAILGNAEVARAILSKERPDLGELREICDDIITEDNRAAEVIRRLGALFKRGEMNFLPLDLNGLVTETLELVRTELMTRHVVAVTELAASLPAVEGERIQLQQVLLNLLLNGADAMSEIDVEQRKLIVRTELQGTNVRLCVVDKGKGIAPDEMKVVFAAFWSTKPGGTGVGLAICQSIVKAHRGSLTVFNNPDGGATFCAQWPVKQEALTIAGGA